MGKFVHLHLHTQYSFLDGAIKIKNLIPRIKELGMDSVAVTDHGSMHGILEFYKAAKKGGIKPIVGCEAYISKKGRFNKQPKDTFHIVLLAKNNEGYRNLMHLVTIGYLEGFYYKPRIDKEVLRMYSAGLICLTACLGGEISRAILSNELIEARKIASEYASIFEPDSFYLEIQPNGLKEQLIVNAEMIKISKELNIPLIATNDSHYLLKEHAKAHDILMKIQMKQTISNERHHDVEEYYIKSPEEMYEYFKDVPEAVENSVKIAEMCNVEIETGKYYLPDFPVPEGMTATEYFEVVSKKGLNERLKEIKNLTLEKEKEYRERLDFEIGVIRQMGFEGYFLIVWDFIKYAKDNGIPVGPGRGSGAGSIVAYSLKITDLDPIPLNLLFERFLNPDRVSMPDFDIDFCQDRRGEVIEYVRKKYGEFRVAQIANFNQLKAKSVIRDVGRVLEVPLKDVDVLAKMIPDDLDIDLDKALERNPKIIEAMNNNSTYTQIIEIGKALEGLYRQAGVHAAGIVIGNKDIWNYTPLFVGNDGFYVTQFEKNNVEEVGLVKFDFLGLKTLTVIDKAVKYVNASRKKEDWLDISKIDVEDPNIYTIYKTGNTDGIFQFESSGMKKYLKDLKPDCFADIIAMNALYRPGPMEYIPNYVARKHGKEKIVYDHPSMEEYLKETYGITVYQEQVMLLSRKMAGFTRGQADELRKAMGKKLIDKMEKLYPKFVEGCKKNYNIDVKVAEKIWADWAAFAKYAFNKSHSACYAYVSLQTAYLKQYHPAEFMAAMLSYEASETTKVVKHVISSKEMGLIVVPPDINASMQDFTVEKNKIIFGLSGVKGVGDEALKNIIEERTQNGLFKIFYDFISRIDGRKVNKKVVESLIKAGAFDSICQNRAMLFENTDMAINSAQIEQKNKKAGIKSLFGASKGNSANNPEFKLIEKEEWKDDVKLNYEKEILGFFVSGHPVSKFSAEFESYGCKDILTIVEEGDTNENYKVLATMDNLKIIPTKTGNKMASFFIEDFGDNLRSTCFPTKYKKYEHIFESKTEEALIFIGNIKEERKFNEEENDTGDEEINYNFHVNQILTLDEFRKTHILDIKLELTDELFNDELLNQINNLLALNKNFPTSVNFSLKSIKYKSLIEFSAKEELKTQISDGFYKNLKKLSETFKFNFIFKTLEMPKSKQKGDYY